MNFKIIKNETLAGITSALAMIPESVAFAFVAGVPPIAGLYAAFTVGLITACFGGRPGMVSGAAGALAVVSVSLVSRHGIEYLFAAVILMGVLQMCFGAMKLAKLIRLVPEPVILGFVNGLAVVIFCAQFRHFPAISGSDPAFITMAALVALSMITIYFMPKFTKVLPSSLAAILLVSGVMALFGLSSMSVGDLAKIKADLPSFHIPSVPFTWETLKIIFPFSIVMAGVGLIESLLTMTLVDAKTKSKGNGNRESFVQGVANLTTGVFGGMGGCGMIAQTIVNLSSGGRGRISGVVSGLAILGFIMFGAFALERVAVAALIGVMFMAAIRTFSWASLSIIPRLPRRDLFVMLVTSGLTIAFDLATAVVAGIVISALIYAWDSGTRLKVRRINRLDGFTLYEVNGPLFFGSVTYFVEQLQLENDSAKIQIDLGASRVVDHSGIEVLARIHTEAKSLNKTVYFVNVSSECQERIHTLKPGLLFQETPLNLLEAA